MLTPITRENLGHIENPGLRAYAGQYLDIYDSFTQDVEGLGLAFHTAPDYEEASAHLRADLALLGVQSRGCGASLVRGALSPACEACRTGEGSLTTYISLACNRRCYFCFNPNQEDFETHLHRKKDWRGELSALATSGEPLNDAALTGGEPLLHPEDALAFFTEVRERFPQAHTRLYTAGDLLDKRLARRLADAGLQEVRFSLKLEDPPAVRAKVLRKLAMAVELFPAVMVEMPVIPGTGEEMRTLLDKLEALGIFGVNLLEFCFPCYNAEAFSRRGLELRWPPYRTLYDYWYAGGLPVAGSEPLCLTLLKTAAERGYRMSVHYCSVENKHSGQIYRQNTRLPHTDPTLLFSGKDFYLKSVKAFGPDAQRARNAFRRAGEARFIWEKDLIRFHPEALPLLESYPMELGVCYSVMEERSGGVYCRELRVDHARAGALSPMEL